MFMESGPDLIKKISELEKEIAQKEEIIKLLTNNSFRRVVKQSEEEAFNSNQMLQVILDNIPQCIFWKNKDSVYTGCNRNFAKEAGFKDPFEVLGKTDFEMPWYHSAERFREEDKQIFEKKLAKINYDEEVTLPDGRSFWVRMSKTPLFDSENRVLGLVGVLENITTQKIAASLLSESEYKYRSFFDKSSDGLFIIDNLTKIILANKKLLVLTGYSEEEITELKLRDLLETNAGSIVNDLINNLEQNDILDIETILKSNDGYSIPIELTLNKVDQNKIQGIIRDISGRKKAEEKILQQTVILDSIGQAVFTVDKEENIIYWNHASEKLYGWKKEEVIGKKIETIVNYKNGNYERSERKKDIEFTAKKKNGMSFSAVIDLNPLINENGEHIGVVGISYDITKRKQRIDELKAAKDKAEEINNLKTILLANISHELRTPLSAMFGYCDILESEIINPEHQEIIQSMTLNCRRLLDTLNMILNFSLVESNNFQLQKEVFNVYKELENFSRLFLQSANSKGLFLETVPPGEDLYMNSDKEAFKSILKNVITNSIKFTNKGGISIKCFKETADNKKYVVISVNDTGIGIPEKYKSKIFEEFRQVSEGMCRDYDGTGLGLTVAKKLIEKMDGNISFESIENSGTTFYLKFPLHS